MTIEFMPKDWEKIELYMKAGATQNRIADSMGITDDTLRKKCKERYGEKYETIFRKFNTTGELLLEATQFQKALAGNVPMLIWLGKVRLGQREPEMLSSKPPAQDNIDKDHLIMGLYHTIDMMRSLLKENGIDATKIDAHESKTE